MSVEELIVAARKKKLRVANLYEGTDGVWRCLLYKRADQAPADWPSGSGEDAAEALSIAITKSAKQKPAKPVVGKYDELL